MSICAFNGHIISNRNGSQLTSLQYRKSIIEESISKYQESFAKSKSRRRILPTPLRLTDRHFMEYVPATKKKTKPSRRCAVCAANKIRSESRYQCGECDVGLCAVPCFMYYHSKTNCNNIFE